MNRNMFIVIIRILGAAILIGGTVFAVYWHDCNTVHFDRYHTEFYYMIPDDGTFTDEMKQKLETEQRIKFPQYCMYLSEGKRAKYGVYSSALFIDCYDEVDCACFDYAEKVAYKYHNNADLDFTVECTKTTLTVEFSGTGYPEDGDPEPLLRTYIFDIEGAGADKIPRLLNRAEFIGY